MKIAYSNPDDASGRGLMRDAQENEESGNLQQAAVIYRRIIKMHYRRQHAYQRLMIIYRKLKEYAKEMGIIDEAIDEFSKILYQPKRIHARKIETLSRKLTVSTGLAGKTGNPVHQPEPIAGWEIRKKGLKKLLRRK